MILGRVVGKVVAPQKLASLTGAKLLLVDPLRFDVASGSAGGTQKLVVAVDTLGTGLGEVVLLVQGSSARLASPEGKQPIDAAIVGIVECVQWHDRLLRHADLAGVAT
jgi:ethanolamine utilization protein EutN